MGQGSVATAPSYLLSRRTLPTSCPAGWSDRAWTSKPASTSDVIAAMLAILLIQGATEQARRVEPITYSEFRTYLEQDAKEGEPDTSSPPASIPASDLHLEKHGMNLREHRPTGVMSPAGALRN